MGNRRVGAISACSVKYWYIGAQCCLQASHVIPLSCSFLYAKGLSVCLWTDWIPTAMATGFEVQYNEVAKGTHGGTTCWRLTQKG